MDSNLRFIYERILKYNYFIRENGRSHNPPAIEFTMGISQSSLIIPITMIY